MKINFKRTIIFLILSVLLIIPDQITKQMAVAKLSGTDGVAVIKNIFYLLYIENRGAAFGVFQGKQIFFYIITVIVLIGILYLINKIPSERHYTPMLFVCLLVFAGAIGNFIDRVRQGYVVDFFYFKPIDFPVFNVADIYVTVGCALLILLFFFYYKDEDFNFIK